MINSDGRVIIAPVNDVLSINLSTPIFNKAVAINIYIPSLRVNDIHTKQVETIDFIISLFVLKKNCFSSAIHFLLYKTKFLLPLLLLLISDNLP